MASLPSRTLVPSVLVLLSTFISSARGFLNISDVCLPSSVYSPFKPWPQQLLEVDGPTENLACWYWADCVLSQAGESRKAQFAATSLVMGLVPLILKDIAWPERRLVSVSSGLNFFVEVLVRALGLIPIIDSNANPASLPRWLFKWRFGVATLPLLSLTLLVAYGFLATIEVFSKRSALGCPYPVFIFTWHIVAVIPALARE